MLHFTNRLDRRVRQSLGCSFHISRAPSSSCSALPPISAFPLTDALFWLLLQVARGDRAPHPPDPSSIPGSGRSPGEDIGYPIQYSLAPMVAQLVKNPPAMWETWIRSLGWEDPLEKEMATHSSILAWRLPWTEEPGGLQSTGLQRVGHD